MVIKRTYPLFLLTKFSKRLRSEVTGVYDSFAKEFHPDSYWDEIPLLFVKVSCTQLQDCRVAVSLI